MFVQFTSTFLWYAYKYNIWVIFSQIHHCCQRILISSNILLYIVFTIFIFILIVLHMFKLRFYSLNPLCVLGFIVSLLFGFFYNKFLFFILFCSLLFSKNVLKMHCKCFSTYHMKYWHTCQLRWLTRWPWPF